MNQVHSPESTKLKAVARFSITALQTGELEALLHEAALLVTDGLGVEQAAVLELLPEQDCLIVRAAVGFQPGSSAA